MVNTILNDDERRAMLGEAWAFTETTPTRALYTAQQVMESIAKAEAAVLAKLREQEPVAWIYWHPINDAFDGPDTIRKKAVSTFTNDTRTAMQRDGWVFEPLYAAPLPAVVHVPQFDMEAEAKAIGLPPSIYAHPGVKQLVRAAIAAAPEAPAQDYTLDQIADACVAAEIPDSKFESLCIALKGRA